MAYVELKRLFVYRRQANNTNWRQTSRDEGDEWRQENSRPPNRSSVDKWGELRYYKVYKNY